jgi:hypothetical protein
MSVDFKMPSNWPLQVPFFKLPDDTKMKINKYKLDLEKLPKAQCHLFFPVSLCEEWRVVTALEFYTFHPLTPMNAQFHIDPIKIGDVELMWCRFPIGFKSVCEKAGLVFNMKMKCKSVGMAEGSPQGVRTELGFPRAENVLWFECERSYDPEAINKQLVDIRDVANSVYRLGVD